ncbi:unnamed protein product [Boreogadus saida]
MSPLHRPREEAAGGVLLVVVVSVVGVVVVVVPVVVVLVVTVQLGQPEEEKKKGNERTRRTGDGVYGGLLSTSAVAVPPAATAANKPISLRAPRHPAACLHSPDLLRRAPGHNAEPPSPHKPPTFLLLQPQAEGETELLRGVAQQPWIFPATSVTVATAAFERVGHKEQTNIQAALHSAVSAARLFIRAAAAPEEADPIGSRFDDGRDPRQPSPSTRNRGQRSAPPTHNRNPSDDKERL